MNEQLLIVIREYRDATIASFEKETSYENVPEFAKVVCETLSLKVAESLDGPSERIVKFNLPSLLLVNNPDGTELRASSSKAQYLLRQFCTKYLEAATSRTARVMTPRDSV
jgi:hypothetical protein